jgi:hypothetical protein
MRFGFAPWVAMLIGMAWPAGAVVPPPQPVPPQQVPQPQVPQQAPQAVPGQVPPPPPCDAATIRSQLRDQVVPNFFGCIYRQVQALLAADRLESELQAPRFALAPPILVPRLAAREGTVVDQSPGPVFPIASADMLVTLYVAGAGPVPEPAPVRATGQIAVGADQAGGRGRVAAGERAPAGPFGDPLLAGVIAAAALLGGGVLAWRIWYWVRPDPVVVIDAATAEAGEGAGAAAPPLEARGGLGSEGGEAPRLVEAGPLEVPPVEVEVEVGLGSATLAFEAAPEVIEEGFEDE